MRFTIVAFSLWMLGLGGTAHALTEPDASGAIRPLSVVARLEPGAEVADEFDPWSDDALLDDALPDSPGALLNSEIVGESDSVEPGFRVDEIRVRELNAADVGLPVGAMLFSAQSRAPEPADRTREPYHWKGLILQSVAFSALENGIRIMTADQDDRHILLNKPFWSDYWASLQQFNMRRWNDGDSIPVNYIGHPMQGAISGYIEVQNDPRGRELQISKNPEYWKSLLRATLWSTVYSTQSEIGPMSEASIFNEGGFTYPINCPEKDTKLCPPTSEYTNNTGWVDFIITPVVGTLWMIGSDTIDRYVTNPLVEKHPDAFGYKMLRAGLNPTKSLANILRGHYPWFRDYEHPEMYQSVFVDRFQQAMDAEPNDHVDVFMHYTSLGLGVNTQQCTGCRETTTGAGIGLGFAVRRYLDLVVDSSIQPGASPESSLNVGGTMWSGHAGVRSGYSGQHFALKVLLAPGFASYSRSQSAPDQPIGRNYNFSALAALSGDLRFNDRIAFRVQVDQMLIRYKSLYRDPPGIGSPPWLSFLSHDNYINSTNWGVELGPVIRF